MKVFLQKADSASLVMYNYNLIHQNLQITLLVGLNTQYAKQHLSNFQAHFGKILSNLKLNSKMELLIKKRVPHNTTQHYILTVSKFLCMSIQGGPSRLHRTPFSATIVKFKNG